MRSGNKLSSARSSDVDNSTMTSFVMFQALSFALRSVRYTCVLSVAAGPSSDRRDSRAIALRVPCGLRRACTRAHAARQGRAAARCASCVKHTEKGNKFNYHLYTLHTHDGSLETQPLPLAQAEGLAYCRRRRDR